MYAFALIVPDHQLIFHKPIYPQTGFAVRHLLGSRNSLIVGHIPKDAFNMPTVDHQK